MTKPNPLELAKLSQQTQLVYERNAVLWTESRPKTLVEKPWLNRFLVHSLAEGPILDLGCGAGDPIAGYFFDAGRTVVGIDASQQMIKLAIDQYPNGDWRLQDMRLLDLPERFAGIIGWNSFFHLTRGEQRALIPLLSKHLLPGGSLLLTVGPNDGEVAGHVGKDAVYHASLSPSEYQERLFDCRLEVIDFVPEDPNCYDMSILLAKKAN